MCATTLSAQRHRINWQEACFNHPAAPYCHDRDYAVKKTPNKKEDPRTALKDPLTGGPAASSVVSAGGINWRFADPLADTLAVLDTSKLSSSLAAHQLFSQVGG